MKKLIFLLLLFPLLASGQYLPNAYPFFGNVNIMGGLYVGDTVILNKFNLGSGTDTLLLIVDPATGIVDTFNVNNLPGGSGSVSKWTTNGTTLHPIDTGKYVAVGTDDALGYQMYVDGSFGSVFGDYNLINGSLGTARFCGSYYQDSTGYMISGINTLAMQDYATLGHINTNNDFNLFYSNTDYINAYSIAPSEVDTAFAGIHAMRQRAATTGTETDLHLNTLYGLELSYKTFNGSKVVRGRRLQIDSLGINLDIKNIGGSYETALGIDSLKKITFNEAYTFPLADGNSGDVLTTDGGGTITWQPAGGGDSYWDSTNTVIHTNDSLADVAIGQSYLSGDEKLGVYGGGLLVTGSAGTPTNINGAVMFFNTAKGAFRAGYNTYGYYFADAQVGTYSAGFNNLSLAQGNSSFAANSGVTNAGTASYMSAAFNYGTCGNTYTFAIGEGTQANGATSFAGGISTIAASYCGFAIGRYNVGGGTAGSWVATDYLLEIGNGGSSGTKNNAFSVLKNGTTYIGDASSTQDPVMTVNTTDSTTTLIGVLKLVPMDDPPSSPDEGMIYVDTDHHIYYWDGTAWKQLDN